MKHTEMLRYMIVKNATIREAMEKIDANAHRTLIVVDDEEKVVGALSDGDIRKSLLRGQIMETVVEDIMNVNFVYLTEGSQEKAKERFRELHIIVIPIVDKAMKLLDIVTEY